MFADGTSVVAEIAHPVHSWADSHRAIFKIARIPDDDDYQGEVTWRFTFTRGKLSRSVDTRTSALLYWNVFRREALLQTGYDLGVLSDELWKQLCSAALREMRGEKAPFEQPDVES
jgi:hypothetical protein